MTLKQEIALINRQIEQIRQIKEELLEDIKTWDEEGE